MNDESHQPDTPDRPSNSTLAVYFVSTFISVTVIAISAMLMALGSGLGSSPDAPVLQASSAFWAIGGLAFIPATVLLVVLIGTHRRAIGITLGLVVMLAGLMTALGWFLHSGWEMLGNTSGNVIVIVVMVVPLIAGALMIRESSGLKR